ncbi:peptidylprolyl isomerase [uncultured Algoriphagus sp.]|uniref:peptidylprolyl isomerase n=1 Tax=uncultured Algoriphagus sp. TaxID=417365 RepID=UPI0030EBE27E
MKINFFCFSVMLLLAGCHSLSKSKISKKDISRDIQILTTEGTIVLRLYDDTPLSRNNFLSLVKQDMYDSILFHRVIENFMVQAGERVNEDAFQRKKEIRGFEDLVSAEINSTHFHKRGAVGAARFGDNVNPEQKGSFIQFYIVQGNTYTDSTLDIAEKRINKSLAYNHIINDSVNKSTFEHYQDLLENRTPENEQARNALKIKLDSLAGIEEQRMTPYLFPEAHREVYKTKGGAAHLDQSYTVFGEVISGMDVVDKIAAAQTNKEDRPINDILILSSTLIKRQE